MALDKNRHWYLTEDYKPSLRMWIFTQMAMGAIYGMIVFAAAVLFILALVAVSNILPDDPYATLWPSDAAAPARLV